MDQVAEEIPNGPPERSQPKKTGLGALDEPRQLSGVTGIFDDECSLALEIRKQVVIDSLGDSRTVVRVRCGAASQDKSEEVAIAGEALPEHVTDSW